MSDSITYQAFKERLALELRGSKSGDVTPWMKSVGYRPDDKDMGFTRWCEITGTDKAEYLQTEADQQALEEMAEQLQLEEQLAFAI